MRETLKPINNNADNDKFNGDHNSNEAKKGIVMTAQCMIDGSLNYLIGARHLLKLRHDVSAYANDPLFLPFTAVVLESNGLPFTVSEDKLNTLSPSQQKALNASIKWARNISLSACHELIQRYQSVPDT